MATSVLSEWGYWPMDKRRRLPSHKNRGLEIVLIQRGQLLWQVEGRIEPVSAGQVFFTFPWETHGSAREQEPGCELYYAVVKLRRDRRAAAVSARFDSRLDVSHALSKSLLSSLLSASHRGWPATRRLAMLMPELVEEMQRPAPQPAAVESMARLMLIELQRSVAGEGRVSHQPGALLAVKQFVQRLPGECHRPWSLQRMADACELGRTRFSDLLKQLTGDTPKMALARARVERACSMLRTTTLPITRVALDCGFSSSQQFANVFRAYTGKSATRYRAVSTRDSKVR
jgi:AraC-like DNA-binding protein